MTTQTYYGTLVIEDCCNCGVTFGMEESMQKRLRQDHKTFYCPNGHGQHYTGKTTEQKLREELEFEQRRLINERARRREAQDAAEAVARSLAAQKGHNTRLRKRAANGVCPCCTRTFSNVARHVSNMHPDYVAAVG